MTGRKTITLRQKNLARNIKNYALSPVKVNAKTLLVDSGYSPKTAINPHVILNQKGLKQALVDEGISLENSDNVVKSILNSPVVYEMVTPDNQLRAADYIAKRLNGFQGENSKNTLNINIFSPEQAKAIAERLIQKSLEAQEQ